MNDLQFAVEPYLKVIPEMAAIYPEHWEEIALDRDSIKLDPDYTRYARMALEGTLHVVTARHDGKLVGYHISMIAPHLHYKSSLTCFTDIFYLRREYREGLNGYLMLKFFHDSLAGSPVQKIYMGTKLGLDLAPILDRLGFKAIERLYTKVLHD